MCTGSRLLLQVGVKDTPPSDQILLKTIILFSFLYLATISLISYRLICTIVLYISRSLHECQGMPMKLDYKSYHSTEFDLLIYPRILVSNKSEHVE